MDNIEYFNLFTNNLIKLGMDNTFRQDYNRHCLKNGIKILIKKCGIRWWRSNVIISKEKFIEIASELLLCNDSQHNAFISFITGISFFSLDNMWLRVKFVIVSNGKEKAIMIKKYDGSYLGDENW